MLTQSLGLMAGTYGTRHDKTMKKWQHIFNVTLHLNTSEATYVNSACSVVT